MRNTLQNYFLMSQNERGTQKIIQDTYDAQNEQLFDQGFNEEEDFEIPAFLRRQKF